MKLRPFLGLGLCLAITVQPVRAGEALKAPADGIPVGGETGRPPDDAEIAPPGGGDGGWLGGGGGGLASVDLNDKGTQVPEFPLIAVKGKNLIRTWPGLKKVIVEFQAGRHPAGVQIMKDTLAQCDQAKAANPGWREGKQAAATRAAYALALEMPQNTQAQEEAVGAAAEQSSPLLLDMNGNGRADVTSPHVHGALGAFVREGAVAFDIAGRGHGRVTEWLVPGADGLLAMDGNGNGTVDGITELFGDADGYDHGYAKLAILDRDRDGAVAGPELAGLSVWIDDGDGHCEPGELRSVQDHGITKLHVEHDDLASTMVRHGKLARTWDWFPRMAAALASARPGGLD